MGKLREVVRFEIATALRYVVIFYLIQYSVVAVTLFLTWLGRGSLDHPYFAALETCAMIFVFIFGALGFGEDFKMLLQNGFTRRVHFVAALVLFVVAAMLLALVDTLAARGIEAVAHGYWSLFTAIYGPNQALALQFLWRFGVYLVLACAGYFCALVVARLGTKRTIFLGIVLWCMGVLALPTLYVELLPDAWRYSFGTQVNTALLHCAGFTAEGVQLSWPIVSLTVLAAFGFAVCFALVRRAPLR